MALNKALVGKQYAPLEYKITADEARKYALGYNEDLPLFLDDTRPNGIIAPPMFAVKYAGSTIVNAFFDPELNVNFARLVHGEQDMEFLEPVRPGDTVTTVLKIGSVEEKSTGEVFTTVTDSRNQKGQVVVRTVSAFFIRGDKSGAAKPRQEQQEQAPPKEFLFTEHMQVRENQTYIYAEGSGDHNPIHVDPEFARKVGLPGIILQGLCTMAFCFKAVQDGACGQDPLRVRRLRVRFAKPVLPLDTISTRAWLEKKKSGGIAVLGFEAVNRRGETVIKNGLAEIR